MFVVAFLCGVATFVYLFVTKFIKGNTKAVKFKAKSEQDGCVTEAKAVKFDYRRHIGEDERRNSCIVTYEYFVDNVRYTKKLEFQDVFATITYPDSVMIYYSKQNPRKAYDELELRPDRQKQYAFHLSLIAPIVVIEVVYWVLKITFG